MAGINYLLLIPFALAPSLIWLAFYLRKDSRPEPNSMIVRIFLAGMLVTIPAVYLETFLEGFFSAFPLSSTAFVLLYFFVGIALVEELLKYAVVRFGAFSSSTLDQPLDVMLYMIISALGFAALENVFLLIRLAEFYPASDLFLVNAVRFVQAILLHALTSGVFGYFLALSFLHKHRQVLLFFAGLLSATVLHGLFNLYIFKVADQSIELLLLPVIPLFLLAVFISFAFQQLKNAEAVPIS